MFASTCSFTKNDPLCMAYHPYHFVGEVLLHAVCIINVSLFVPYRSTHGSSDCDETFTSCCKHDRGCFQNLKNLKILLAGVPGVPLPGAYNFHLIAMKLSQVVVNMIVVVLEI